MAPSTDSYDVFISYSHALDGTLAPTLQRELEQFAKPWYRVRSLRVFRDDASLSANPSLWSSIEQALSNSSWFVLLASPAAARSIWVNREVSWWLAHRSIDRLLIVRTEGEFRWDGHGGDCDGATAALPPALRGAFVEEPRWVDLRWLRDVEQVHRSNPRLRECVADIAAAVREVPKDELIGEHIRQHRRTMRLARGAISALIVLTVAALIAAFIAVGQRNTARSQARIATARALASAAVANLDTRLNLAQLFAAEAYRMDQNAQTRYALFQAVSASPQIARYLPIGMPASTVAGSADGHVVAAGTEDGRLLRWDLIRRTRMETKVSAQRIVNIGLSADGDVVAAAVGSTAYRWTPAQNTTQSLPVVAGANAALAAVSPSGHLAVVLANGPSTQGGTLTVHEGNTKNEANVGNSSQWRKLVLPTDSTLMLLSYSGDWEQRSVADLRVTAASTEARSLAANSLTTGYSSDGGYFGFTGPPGTDLWRTTDQRAEPYFHTDVSIDAPNPGDFAVSPDGARIAVTRAGTITLVDTKNKNLGGPRQLTGGNSTSVQFLGDDNHLLSTTHDALIIWDLTQHTRISTLLPMSVPSSCRACTSPRLAVQSDGQYVAAIGNGDVLAVGALRAPLEAQTVNAPQDLRYGLPVWSADGRRLFIATPANGGVEVRNSTTSLPLVGNWPKAAYSGFITAARIYRDGRDVILVDERGNITIRDTSTGQVQRTVVVNTELSSYPTSDRPNLAAISADGMVVALSGPQTVKLIDVNTGNVHNLPGGGAYAVEFTDDRLFVQRTNGTVELWNTNGTGLIRTIPGDSGDEQGLTPSSDDELMAHLLNDGTAVITDLLSGDRLGAIQIPDSTDAQHTTMTFIPGKHVLIIATAGGRATVLNLTVEAWLRSACETAGRDLTNDEWRRFVGTEPPTNLICRR